MIDHRLGFAVELARKAGDLVRQGYGQTIQANHKGTLDLVTEYDVRSERLVTEAIRQAFPEDAILAEESGQSGTGDLRWLIDPLDGTTNFAHGLPIFCVSIAYARGNEPLLGVIFDPTRDELFQTSAGGGAWLNGRRLHVSKETSLSESLLVTGFPYDIRTNADNNLDHFAAFAMRSRAVRRLGSAALDLAYVAAGRFEGHWELRLSPWDFAAGILLVREAGGTVTRADGGPDVFAEPTSLLATNGSVHQEMLSVLNR